LNFTPPRDKDGTAVNLAPLMSLVLLAAAGVGAYGLSRAVRRKVRDPQAMTTEPWLATLGYVATAYGVIIGFSVLFLFGEFSSARQAVGAEATSIGTAFEEMALFPEAAPAVRESLICYSRAVVEQEWPAMQRGASAPEVDDAYRQIFVSLKSASTPLESTFQPATATNVVVQVGNISTAREERLVAATTRLPVMMWGLLLGGAVFILAMIFVVTLRATPRTQALLVGLSTAFTVVLVLLVAALNNPFASGGSRVSPELLEQTTVAMQAELPLAPGACDQAR
jgi:hypothetical protein